MYSSDTDLPDWHPAQGSQALRDAFEQQGLVLLKDIATYETFTAELGRLGRIHYRHDAQRDGLTHIHPGSGAMSRYHFDPDQTGLPPHTDRCALDKPPRMLAIWIERQSAVGGLPLFANGQAIFDGVSVHAPEIMSTLCRRGCIAFKSETGQFLESRVFDLDGERLSIRFKLDRMVFLAPDMMDIMPRFQAVIRQTMFTRRVASGDGYLIDNHRWLHGRTPFLGPRSAYRLLLDDPLESALAQTPC